VRRSSKQWIWTIAVLAQALQSQGAFGGNKLELLRENNVLTIQFSNTDCVAGFQFTINARGGIALRSFRGSDRAAAGGLAVFQYLPDDSTLNVIMIAPVRSSLPAGEGVLGQISFVLNETSSADTVRVSFSRSSFAMPMRSTLKSLQSNSSGTPARIRKPALLSSFLNRIFQTLQSFHHHRVHARETGNRAAGDL